MVRSHDHAGCPTDDDLAAYLQGRLASIELSAIEDHVSRCSPCRHLVSGLARATRSQGSAIDSQTPTLRQTAWSPSGELPAGARIGRYIVLEWRGSGGMGVVYAAYDPELDRKIALKVLRDGQRAAARPVIRDLLRREAQAMARLSHPHVVSVFDVGNVNDCMFIAMELIEGENLCQWLATEPRSRDQIIACFTAAGSGLAAAHAAGLVHRDFKPDNVLIGHDGRVCVTDFGLARRASGERDDAADRTIAEPGAAETTSTGVAGTLAYMAPEQYLCRPTDARADQFSFAVALYKALYGELPFSRSRFSKRDRRASAVREAPRGSTVPIALRQVLLRALSADPAARYPAMTDLLAALAQTAAQAWRPTEKYVAPGCAK